MSTDTLDQSVVVIMAHFTGKRRQTFAESINVLRESVALGGWLPRGRQRVSKGLNKGLISHRRTLTPAHAYDNDRAERERAFRAYMAITYGNFIPHDDVAAVTDDALAGIVPTVPLSTARAWLRLLAVVRELVADLDASRPLPAYTDLGISPKVTATLLDSAIELDLATRRVCPLGWRWEPARDKHGDVICDASRQPLQVKVYFPKWPPCTVFGSSRFRGCDCEACGKTIPSGMVVPLLIDDRAGAVHGFWFGRDCARNILGIKDVGLLRS